MKIAVERLTSLRVKDVMCRDVLTVDESEDLQSAARRLYDRDVSGAPVVNSLGRCVGVLSASDFVARDAEESPREILVRTNPDEPYRVESLDDNLVASHMTPFVQTISEDASVLEAARIMCAEHIHRVIAVDEEQRPHGILTALDIVAATIAAIEEHTFAEGDELPQVDVPTIAEGEKQQ